MAKKVIVLTEFYEPGFKGGGPIQSIKNLVSNLGSEIDFYIITSDRDLGDQKPFNNIKVEEWQKVGNANVFYTDMKKFSINKLRKINENVEADVLYLNEIFTLKLSILPIIFYQLKILKFGKVIISPRGQFSSGALNFKKNIKQIFLQLAKFSNLYNNVIWHATAETEKSDIEKIFGKKVRIEIATNLTANYQNKEYQQKQCKKVGYLKLVFLSRIHPKKNLDYALESLKGITGNVTFDIYGPIEDQEYWEKCQRIIDNLGNNIDVQYRGSISHDKISSVFQENQIFLFPTKGENYGHVISESLIGGCPVVISDQTPWLNLEQKGVGWDILLEKTEEYTRVIQYCVNMDNQEYSKMSKKAFEYGKNQAINLELIDTYYQMIG